MSRIRDRTYVPNDQQVTNELYYHACNDSNSGLQACACICIAMQFRSYYVHTDCRTSSRVVKPACRSAGSSLATDSLVVVAVTGLHRQLHARRRSAALGRRPVVAEVEDQLHQAQQRSHAVRDLNLLAYISVHQSTIYIFIYNYICIQIHHACMD